MRSISIFIICFLLGSGGCTGTGKDQPKTTKNAKKQYKYVCIMHPQTGSDKPGICPKCGMQLVERDTDK